MSLMVSVTSFNLELCYFYGVNSATSILLLAYQQNCQFQFGWGGFLTTCAITPGKIG